MTVERVLDIRISDASEDGDVAEVPGQVTTVFSDPSTSCGPSGLPSYLLLSFSPAISTGALGVAAFAFISRMVLVVTDEGATVLQAWFNQPLPVTSLSRRSGCSVRAYFNGVEPLDNLLLVVACDCAPSLVAQRLSL